MHGYKNRAKWHTYVLPDDKGNGEPLIHNTLGESQQGPITKSLLTILSKHVTDSQQDHSVQWVFPFNLKTP